MRPDDESLLVDMLVAAREAMDIASVETSEPRQLRLMELALERLVQNIGEAASKLSIPTREQLPHIPWHDVVGMRNRLVHNYSQVDPKKVWAVIEHDLAALVEAIEGLVTPDESG